MTNAQVQRQPGIHAPIVLHKIADLPLPPSKFDHAIGAERGQSQNFSCIQGDRLSLQETLDAPKLPTTPDTAAADVIRLDTLQVATELESMLATNQIKCVAFLENILLIVGRRGVQIP